MPVLLKAAEDPATADQRPMVVDRDVGDADLLCDARMLARARQVQDRRLALGGLGAEEKPGGRQRGNRGMETHNAHDSRAGPGVLERARNVKSGSPVGA